jgi:serine/threonine protein kinase
MAEESHFSGADARRPWALPPSLSHLIVDRFQLLGRIQRGPQASLYLCIDHEDDAEVLLKVFDRDPLDLAAAQPPLAAELLQEHPLQGTPRVVEVGVVDGHAFVATEMVRGQSLAERLKGGPTPISQAIELTQTICAVLAQAHPLGIVHGDLKPRNVLFREEDRLPLLLDFGRAVPPALIPSLSAEEGREAVMFLSPEQLSGGAPTAASDVFALGVLLYRLISGRDPFPGETAAEILRARASQPATPIESVMPDAELPAVVQWIVTRCMAPEPKDRFPDAVKLSRVLETWASVTSPPRDAAPEPELPPDTVADAQAAPSLDDLTATTPASLAHNPVFGVNGPTLEPTAEMLAPVVSSMEQHHVRAWHVDLDAAAAVHQALVAADTEPTQPGVAITAPLLAPAAAAPVAAPLAAPPVAEARSVPAYAWGVAAVAAIGGLAAYLFS